MKIWLDAGHGGTDSGAVGNGLLEKDLTLKIINKIALKLADYYVTVGTTRLGDITMSLGERTKKANIWGADFFLSIHINSATASTANGFESFIYDKLDDKSKTNDIRNIIHHEIITATKWNDRGKKKANFHVLRESAMPALLTENGFISSAIDTALLKNDSFLEKIAQGHVNGLVKAFNLQKKQVQQQTPKKLYYVQAGAFTEKAGAEKLVKQLAEKGFPSIIK